MLTFRCNSIRSSNYALIVNHNTFASIVSVSMKRPLKASIDTLNATSFPIRHAKDICFLKQGQTMWDLPVSICKNTKSQCCQFLIWWPELATLAGKVSTLTNDLHEFSLLVELHNPAVAIPVGNEKVTRSRDSNGSWHTKMGLVFSRFHPGAKDKVGFVLAFGYLEMGKISTFRNVEILEFFSPFFFFLQKFREIVLFSLPSSLDVIRHLSRNDCLLRQSSIRAASKRGLFRKKRWPFRCPDPTS